ncbi:HEAT repeat domain-containing protein [Microcoleus sp. bin38.metabat.b11b12b14.051]|uniref:HEAT repeat domain-containing protein n=1 Tax=Microcoleus sp. bin38.metabat.b11b12b14.051 TaxID=2742709 RepID=UPI003458E228
MLNETDRFQLRESVGYRVMGASLFELAGDLGWLNLVARDAETAEGIYAFYHPTFQEYFAALAVEDWHFFLNHIPGNPQHPDARYRIFEKQWKEVILLWLGREEVGKDEKEAFIKALVKFEDGCDGGFYWYRAYFLAAAGIVEFKDCSFADEIVSKIIKQGFGYFDDEIQQWVNVNRTVFRRAKEILKDTDRERAIAALVKLTRNSGDKRTRWVAAGGLGEIGKDNPVAISALVQLIRTSQDENTRKEAAESLGKVGKDNSVAIVALVELISNSGDKHTRMEAANSLGTIDKDNPVALATLADLIRNSSDEDTLRKLVASLGKIGKNNSEAIATLAELICNSGEVSTRMEAAYSLGAIDKDNPVALAALVELINNSGDDYTRWRAAACLGIINKDNSVALSALVELIRNAGDENIRRMATYSLGEINTNNPEAIAALVELIRNCGDKVTRMVATDSLEKIGKNNPVVRATFVELIRHSDRENNRSIVTNSLEEIGKDNSEKIAALVNLIRNSGNVSAQRNAAFQLRAIMKDKYFATAVSSLKDCLTSQDRRKSFNRYNQCYRVIWECAQNMTYPDFYQAWHSQPTNSPIPDNSQNTDRPTLLKQLKPTDKTFPVPLNIRALEGETDISAIAQELCTQLYQTIFPTDTDIPAIRNAPEFKRLIPQLKNRLQTQHIALILHSCPCENALSSFTRKLADSHMGIHIAWITDTALELPLTGFGVDGVDLLDAVQDWIGGIGA